MKKRDISATIGFCASLVVHGGIVLSMLVVYVRDVDRHGRWEALGRVWHGEEIISREGEFGESKGVGEAANSLSGEEIYQGRLGPQDQAPLSRDPVGNGEIVEEAKSFSALREEVAVAMPESLSVAAREIAPFGVGELAMVAPVVVKEKRANTRFAPTEQVARGGGDPAPMSESESDAFSRTGTIVVKNGKVDARLGRNFKSVRPRLSLKAEIDAISVQRPVVEMKIYLDETGKVTDVKVLRSSGSNEIDLPTTTAMYQWWIEPGKDKEGKAIKDVILVTFSYL
jgi:TonB family protein